MSSPEAVDGRYGERHDGGEYADDDDAHAHHPDDLHLGRALPEDQLVHVPADKPFEC